MNYDQRPIIRVIPNVNVTMHEVRRQDGISYIVTLGAIPMTTHDVASDVGGIQFLEEA